jgi:hypothetical protein
VRFPAIIIFVSVMISMNVILLGSITTHLLYAQHDNSEQLDNNANNLLTVHKLIPSFPYIPLTASPNQTMAKSMLAISDSQSKTNETASNDNSTFLTYKDPNYGIQIQYPSTWRKVVIQMRENTESGSSNEIVKFRSPPGTVPVSLGIIVRTGSQLIPLQVYVNAGIDVLKKTFSGFNLISSDATTLGGVPAQKMVYTANLPSGLKLKLLQFLAIRDSTSYVITAGTLPGEFATYLPTLQRMISSLSIISPTTLLSSSSEAVPTPSLFCNAGIITPICK